MMKKKIILTAIICFTFLLGIKVGRQIEEKQKPQSPQTLIKTKSLDTPEPEETEPSVSEYREQPVIREQKGSVVRSEVVIHTDSNEISSTGVYTSEQNMPERKSNAPVYEGDPENTAEVPLPDTGTQQVNAKDITDQLQNVRDGCDSIRDKLNMLSMGLSMNGSGMNSCERELEKLQVSLSAVQETLNQTEEPGIDLSGILDRIEQIRKSLSVISDDGIGSYRNLVTELQDDTDGVIADLNELQNLVESTEKNPS